MSIARKIAWLAAVSSLALLGLGASGCVASADDDAQDQVGEAEGNLSLFLDPLKGCGAEAAGITDSTLWSYYVTGPWTHSPSPYGTSTCQGMNVNYTHPLAVPANDATCAVTATWDAALPTSQGECVNSYTLVEGYAGSTLVSQVVPKYGVWDGSSCTMPVAGVVATSATHTAAIAMKWVSTPKGAFLVQSPVSSRANCGGKNPG
jgi:hypothetical protein